MKINTVYLFIYEKIWFICIDKSHLVNWISIAQRDQLRINVVIDTFREMQRLSFLK